MSTTAKRSVTVNFSGDYDGDNTFSAADNVVSPAQTQFIDLSSGDNTVTVPTAATTPSTAPTAVTIIPPVGNTQAIKLKGDAGDVGVQLHDTDPTSLSLDSSVVNFILNAAAAVNGVRLVWS
jgi:hypothetical protein